MLFGLAALAAGALLLYLGATALVKGSSSLARSFGVAPAVIGLTVVAFGTSLPELAVTVTAAMKDSSDMALGNIIGSNIANIALILGAASLIRPLKVEFTLLKREAPMGIVALLGVILLSADGQLSRVDGIILLMGFAAFLYWSVMVERQAPDEVQKTLDRDGRDDNRTRNVVMTVGGLVAVLAGGNLMVEGGLRVADILEIPKVVVGLSIVAIGTSLPELATSMVAIMKGEDDIGVGGVLGSNLFNLLGILGIAALLSPINVPATFFNFQYPVALFFTLGLLPLARTGEGITRWEGALLLTCYLAYLAALYSMPQFM